MHQLSSLHSTLHAISSSCKTFQEAGVHFTALTNDLASKCSSMQNPKLPVILGPQVADTLNTLSHVLTHIADSQTQLFDSFNASITTAFAAFADKELAAGTTFRHELTSAEAEEDSHMEKYLSGDVVGAGGVVATAMTATGGALNKLGSSALRAWNKRGGRKDSAPSEVSLAKFPFFFCGSAIVLSSHRFSIRHRRISVTMSPLLCDRQRTFAPTLR